MSAETEDAMVTDCGLCGEKVSTHDKGVVWSANGYVHSTCPPCFYCRNSHYSGRECDCVCHGGREETQGKSER
jgi:hypothetical protein